MPLLVNPLIYTSFPDVGFQSLSSQKVPLEVQQAFVEQVVYRYWDTYNPPPAGYRAGYLHQSAPNHTLLGWLYNDGKDDLGRSHIPYFITYHFVGILSPTQLETLLSCLETGPVWVVDRKNPPKQLESIIVPDGAYYQSARQGIPISPELRRESQGKLQKKELLHLFIAHSIDNQATVFDPPVPDATPPNGKIHLSVASQSSPLSSHESLPTDGLETILQELMAKPIGIQAAVLVSAEGQPLTHPLGIDEDTALIMAGSLLYVAQNTQEELNWGDIDHVSIRGKEGHIILARCHQDTFLLVKAGKALTGLLEGEINRSLKKIKGELDENGSFTTKATALPKLEAKAPDSSEELLYEIETESALNTEEIRYRGRKMG